MTNNQIASYGFYIALIVIAGAGEYLHMVPSGTMGGILYGILGHGISQVSYANGVTTTK